MAQKRKHTPPYEEGDESTTKAVYQSNTIEDRSSTFTAYFSPVLSYRELQSLPEIKSASHKILAWRKESAQRSLTPGRAQYTSDYDDDGEKYGGKTVQKVLDRMNVVGACVVARWYGGVMLGQVRFSHMENCARDAVQKYQAAKAERHSKKQKVANEENERQDLLDTLLQRDENILVLRTLAIEKENAVKKAIVAGVDAFQEKDKDVPKQNSSETNKAPNPAPASPSMKMNYAVMPLERLRAVDKARDATVSFLLKRINKAEADLAALADLDPP